MFSIFRKKAINYFSVEEKEKIRNAILEAEKNTSGEIRVFVEHFCRHEKAVNRAAEVFHSLKMEQTLNRNATLVYVALQHRKLAIYADSGIYSKVDPTFWDETIHKMQEHFKSEKYAEGIGSAVRIIGEALAHHFPAEGAAVKNDLPDDLVFGK